MYLFLFQAVNCSLRWLRNEDNELHGLLAGFVAGFSMMWYKSSTIAMYFASKLVEVGRQLLLLFFLCVTSTTVFEPTCAYSLSVCPSVRLSGDIHLQCCWVCHQIADKGSFISASNCKIRKFMQNIFFFYLSNFSSMGCICH